GSAFWGDKEALARSHFASDADHFFVIDSNGAAVGSTKNVQDKEIADRFWNAQTGSACVRVWKLGCGKLAVFKCVHNRGATARLNRKHSRPFFPDPAEDLHFVERFPHSDEAGAA